MCVEGTYLVGTVREVHADDVHTSLSEVKEGLHRVGVGTDGADDAALAVVVWSVIDVELGHVGQSRVGISDAGSEGVRLFLVVGHWCWGRVVLLRGGWLVFVSFRRNAARRQGTEQRAQQRKQRMKQKEKKKKKKKKKKDQS